MKDQGLKRIGFLEGLRGFLAIWVMFAHTGYFVGLSHLAPTDPWHPGILSKILVYLDQSGWDAVNLFMILSGFVISYLVDQGKEGYVPYVVRRFLRLWPVFMLCVVAGALLNGFYADFLRNNPWTHNSWIVSQLETVEIVQQRMSPYLFFHSLMLHGVVPPWVLAKASAAFSSLAWCISTEWQFYLVAPLLFVGMKKPFVRWIISAGVLFVIIRPEIFDFSVNPAASLLPLQIHWFFLGLISYRLYRSIISAGLTWQRFVPVVLYTVALTYFKPRHGVAAWVWLVIFTLLVESARGRKSVLSSAMVRFLESALSRYFGKISYPIYLLHWPISILLLKALLNFPNLSWSAAYIILIIAVPALTWPLSHLTHYYFETPAMELGRKWATKISKQTARVAPLSSDDQPESSKNQLV